MSPDITFGEQMVQAKFTDIFAPETQMGIRLFTGGREYVDVDNLSTEEADSIRYCFEKNVKMIENVSPKLAASIRPQREAFVKLASVAKGTFPDSKNYTYPAQPGGLGCDFINPHLYDYDTDANIDGYDAETWNISLTAGTVAYLAGNSSSTYYTGNSQTNYHSFVVIAQDGIVEIGTSPKISQLQFKSQIMDKYAAISVQPLMTQSIEEGKQIYQYNTPGIIPMSHITGFNIGAYPYATGQSTIALVGMVFYEYDFQNMASRTTTAPGG